MRWSFIQAVSSFLISACLISIPHLSKYIPFPVKSSNVFDLLDRRQTIRFISLGNNNDEGDDYDGEIDVDQEDKEEKNDSDDDDDDVGEERGR